MEIKNEVQNPTLKNFQHILFKSTGQISHCIMKIKFQGEIFRALIFFCKAIGTNCFLFSYLFLFPQKSQISKKISLFGDAKRRDIIVHIKIAI